VLEIHENERESSSDLAKQVMRLCLIWKRLDLDFGRT